MLRRRGQNFCMLERRCTIKLDVERERVCLSDKWNSVLWTLEPTPMRWVVCDQVKAASYALCKSDVKTQGDTPSPEPLVD